MEINKDSFTLAEHLQYHSEHSDEKLLNRAINDTTEEMFRVADSGYTELTIKMWHSNLDKYLETIDKQWDKFSQHFEEQGITVTKEYIQGYTQVSIQGVQGSAKYLGTVNLSWGEN